MWKERNESLSCGGMCVCNIGDRPDLLCFALSPVYANPGFKLSYVAIPQRFGYDAICQFEY